MESNNMFQLKGENNREVPATRDQTDKNQGFGFKPTATNGTFFRNFESDPNKQLSSCFFGHNTISGQVSQAPMFKGGFFKNTNSLGGAMLQSRKEVKQTHGNAKHTDPPSLVQVPNGKPSNNRPQQVMAPGTKLIDFQDDVMTYLANESDKFLVKSTLEANRKILVKSLRMVLGMSKSLKLRRESTILAIYMLHRMASVRTDSESLPSFIIPALMIGGKTEEYFAPTIKDFILTQHNSDLYRDLKHSLENSTGSIKKLEALILEQVSYNTIHPPVLDLVNILASELGLSRDLLLTIQQDLIYELLLIPDVFTYTMVQIACACLLIANEKEKENHRVSESRHKGSGLEEQLDRLIEAKYKHKMSWKKTRALIQAFYNR